ncbi:MAG: hypothetical protein LBB26_02755 [Puniceicoccales bacterium]|jgi:hypothetical protein|nr:hypothetical protein [Puniceicoccales bacterium]
MKSTTDTAAFALNIFDGDWELQAFPVLGLPPGLKQETSFLGKFPAFLERASPLPDAKAIGEIST